MNSCSLNLSAVQSTIYGVVSAMDAFAQCEDSLNYCTSNVDVAKELAGDTKTSMAEDFSLYYTIGTNQGGQGGSLDHNILRNYFCSWSIDLNIERRY